MTTKRFGVEYDSECEEYHVCSDDLVNFDDGSRNSLCDTKDRDVAFDVVEHLKKQHNGPYWWRDHTHLRDQIEVMTHDLNVLIRMDDPVKVGRLVAYLNR